MRSAGPFVSSLFGDAGPAAAPSPRRQGSAATRVLATEGSDAEVVAELIATFKSMRGGLSDGTLTLTLDIGRLCSALRFVNRAFDDANRRDAALSVSSIALVTALAELKNLQLDTTAPETVRIPPRSPLVPPLLVSLRILRIKGRQLAPLCAFVRANCRHSLQELAMAGSGDGGQPFDMSKLFSGSCAWPLLKRLVVRKCGVTSASSGGAVLRALPALRSIDLQHNALTELCAAQYNSALATLDLSFNRIASLERANRRLGNVHSLVLSFNCIESTSGLEKLYGLRSLDLRHNLIAEIDDITRLGALPVLEVLALAGNPIAWESHFRKRAVAALVAERGADSSICVLDGRAVEHAGSRTPAQLRKVRASRLPLHFMRILLTV